MINTDLSQIPEYSKQAVETVVKLSDNDFLARADIFLVQMFDKYGIFETVAGLLVITFILLFILFNIGKGGSSKKDGTQMNKEVEKTPENTPEETDTEEPEEDTYGKLEFFKNVGLSKMGEYHFYNNEDDSYAFSTLTLGNSILLSAESVEGELESIIVPIEEFYEEVGRVSTKTKDLYSMEEFLDSIGNGKYGDEFYFYEEDESAFEYHAIVLVDKIIFIVTNGSNGFSIQLIDKTNFQKM